MTNKKISDLTATTTVGASDLFPIVQSGATKKITGANLITAVAPANATTSAAGIIEIATNAETVTGTDTSRAITPDDLRYGAANGAFQKVVLNGATGSVSNGDMNVSGNYYINGVAVAQGAPTFTPVALSGSNSVITVDFATYNTYQLIISGTAISVGGAGTQIEASSNSGSSYATTAYIGYSVSSGTVTDRTTNILAAGTGVFHFDILMSQPSTSGAVFADSFGGAASVQTIFAHMPVSAACNRIRITASTSWTGFYTLIPICKR